MGIDLRSQCAEALFIGLRHMCEGFAHELAELLIRRFSVGIREVRSVHRFEYSAKKRFDPRLLDASVPTFALATPLAATCAPAPTPRNRRIGA